MPTVRFEPTIFTAGAQQNGAAQSVVSEVGTPVNYTPTGTSAKGFGPLAASATIVIKNYGGGVYINHGPDGALPTAGAATAGSRHLPAGAFEIMKLPAGSSIAVITGEIT